MAIKILRSVYVFVFALAVYLGLSLLGWGLNDLESFFADATRSTYSTTVFLFALLFGVQAFHSLEGIQDGKGQAGKKVKRQTIIGGILVGILFLGLFLIPFTSRRAIGVFQPFLPLSWLGVLLSALGYGLIFWSSLALGRQYSAEVTIQEDHRLITSGPYRLIRHPRYLGILCVCLGVSFVFHTWIGLAIFPPVLGLVLSRIHDEEQLMLEEFGDRWTAYRKKSWQLIPYVF
jgi:protein-S-isoprenylcysteine O-methyltransferase Ste14